MSFKLGHVSIPKRRILLPLFLFCAYNSSVLQNFKIFTHLLPNFSYKDPRQTEVTYHCINFNDRVRKVPKIYYLNVWNVSDPCHERLWIYHDFESIQPCISSFSFPWDMEFVMVLSPYFTSDSIFFSYYDNKFILLLYPYHQI